MIALLLNSGLGSRMGDETKLHPKCMCPLDERDTIISWQVKLLLACGVREAVVTTGHLASVLREYLLGLHSGMTFHFVHNDLFAQTNYIYSAYLARALLHDDIVSLHGDLVMAPEVLRALLDSPTSVVAVDPSLPLPEKDFKAELVGDRVKAIGVDRFGEGCVACQPAYKLLKRDAERWMAEISRFVARGETRCYAENALNAAWEDIALHPLDVGGRLCAEIDNQTDRLAITARFLKEIRQ